MGIEDMTSGFRKYVALVRDVVIYMPFDFFTIPIRDKVIPRKLKEFAPELSCRRYFRYTSPSAECKASEKYDKRGRMAYVCKWYNPANNGCKKRP